MKQLLCSGSASAGKSLGCRLRMLRYVREGKVPLWVLDIQELMLSLNLGCAITCNENNILFHVLHIPEDDKLNAVFEKTKELGLILNVHQIKMPVYDVHPSWALEKPKIIGTKNGKITFTIREAKPNEKTDEICYTYEWRFL